MKNQMVQFNNNQTSDTPNLSSALVKLTQITSRAVDTIIRTISDYNDSLRTDHEETPSLKQTQLRASYAGNSGRVCYVLDKSYSVSEMCDSQTTKLQAIKNACIVALNALAHSSPNTKVAIICFDSKAKIISPFVGVSQDYQQLFTDIQNLTAGGNTNISHALEAAWQLFGQGSSTPNDRLMLLTDGYGGDATCIADQIKSLGVTIETIGFGRDSSCVDENNLRQIASIENGRPLYNFADNKKKLTRTVIQATQIRAH
jgi:Mg-chelatase subunit ChlD